MEWLKTDPRALLGDRRAEAAWSVEDRLDRVTCPVLIVVGAHQDEQTATAARALADRLASARVATLEAPPATARRSVPDALAKLIATFLAEIPAEAVDSSAVPT